MKLSTYRTLVFFFISCAFVGKKDKDICAGFNLKLEQSYDNKFYVFDSIYIGMPYDQYINYYNKRRPIDNNQPCLGCDSDPRFPINICLNDTTKVIFSDCSPLSTQTNRVTMLSIRICFWDNENKLNYKYINQVIDVFITKASKGLNRAFVKDEFNNFICETDKIKMKVASIGGYIEIEIAESK
jgi:hypothetical protein